MAFETAQIDNTMTRRVHASPYASARNWRHWIQLSLYVPAGYRARVNCFRSSQLPCHAMGIPRVQRGGACVIGKVPTSQDLCRQSWTRRTDLNDSLTKKGTL